jgi:hypothetical protein
MLPEPAEAKSEFGKLREQLVGHVPEGPALPVELVRNAIIGSALALAGALAAVAIVPDPASIRHGGFFLIAANVIGDWAAGLKGAAGPLALSALLSLALDAYSGANARPRTAGATSAWHSRGRGSGPSVPAWCSCWR